MYENCIQDHYKKFHWSLKSEKSSAKIKNVMKAGSYPILKSQSKKISFHKDNKNSEINLNYLFPNEKKSKGCFLWANVITLQDSNNKIATVFPCDYKKNFIDLGIIKEKNDFPLERIVEPDFSEQSCIKKELLSTKEGLIIFSHHKDHCDTWLLTDGPTVIKNWLKNNKNIASSQLSDAGRTALQIIQSGGFEGLHTLADKDVIELLTSMSGKKKDRRLKSFDYKKFEKETDRITKKHITHSIIQTIGSKGLSKKLTNPDVIELLKEISEEPKRSHLIKFKEKMDHKICEIEKSKNGKSDYFDLSPEAQKIKSIQSTIQKLNFEQICSLANSDVIQILESSLDQSNCETLKQEIETKISLNSNQKQSIPKILLNSKAIELGMEVKCNQCYKWSWYALHRLNYSLICDFCLKSYKFPTTDPILEKDTRSRWAYRVIGPFSLLEYAQGGYAVALSIRFFTDIIGRYKANQHPMYNTNKLPDKSYWDDKITWSPGQELTLNSNEKIETDFVIWIQKYNYHKNFSYPDIIFGEAKNCGQFKEKDISRMKQVAELFPCSFLVFSTLRDGNQFSNKEKERLKELAKWGRELDEKTQKSRAPVIILTETELFAQSSLLQTWLETGGEQKKMALRIYNKDNEPYITPLKLADLTQHLYLDMPSP